MLALYLFSLIVGGGLLLISAFGIGHSDTLHGDPGHALHADSAHGALPHEFLSARALLYFLAGFGATGSLMESLTDAPAAVALAWAFATGLMAATAVAGVYGWLRRSESGLVPLSADHLVGLPARVLLPVDAEHRGKIVTVHDGREIELLARLYTREDQACPRGSMVVIVDMDGETALITPMPLLPSDPQ